MSFKFFCPSCGSENFISEPVNRGDELRCGVCGARVEPPDAAFRDENRKDFAGNNIHNKECTPGPENTAKKSAFTSSSGAFGSAGSGNSLEPGSDLNNDNYYQNYPGPGREEPHRKRSQPFMGRILIGLIIVTFIFVPFLKREERQSIVGMRAKMCVSNMKTIDGAVELYFMENSPETGRLPSENGLETLVMRGYLRHAPNCADGGKYRISVSYPHNSGTCEISCSRHGALKSSSGL
ncbi:MAG: hypothetical protein BWY32_03719 [bacterium ADurb.Bin243]|nr:MAG: hypothetical protein BWY32_03719 [bacterium ADurb.Bin243]